MKTIYQIVNITLYAYTVVFETEKSYVVTMQDSDGEYEHICRKKDENKTWFASAEAAETVRQKMKTIQQLQREISNQY